MDIQSLGLSGTTLRATSTTRGVQRRAAIASVIGTTIEWYDFFIYGSAAALVFPSVLFGHSGSAGLMASFATIFVGFLSRPLWRSDLWAHGRPRRAQVDASGEH